MSPELYKNKTMTFLKRRNRAQSLECIFSLRKNDQRKGSLGENGEVHYKHKSELNYLIKVKRLILTEFFNSIL